MSGDPEQEFFADGITEDIITELSRFRELFVISRNSSFAYKGKPVEVQKVARELGVQYVVEGSVRKAGRPRPHHRAADRRRDRPPPLGRALRPRPRGHLRDPGRGDARDRRDAAGPGRGGRARPRRSARRPTTWRPTSACSPARCCTTAATATTTRRRCACSTARSSSTRTTRTRTPGRPACSARPGSTTGARIAALGDAGRSRSWQTALALDDNDSDVHRILAAINLVQDNHDKAALPPGARAEPQSEQRPDRRAAGRDPDLARPAGGRHRVDQEGDAPQSLPPRALLEPPRARLLRRAPLRRGDRRAASRISAPDPCIGAGDGCVPCAARRRGGGRASSACSPDARDARRRSRSPSASRRCTTASPRTASTTARASSWRAFRPRARRRPAAPRRQ